MKLWVGLPVLFAAECWAFVAREVCLGDLGCFGNSGPFYDLLARPVALLPDGPESIKTTFRLYTPQNLLLPEVLQYDTGASSLAATKFDPELETKIIVHGFRESEEDWMIDLKDAFLARDSLNVITVDWGGGSGIPYTQAASNTRVVGAQVALLIARLQNQTGLDLDRVHLIGFSLGSHICGYAGQRINKVKRITALDPAGPLFEGVSPVVRLDPSDAQFVDAIHTDGRTLLQLAFGSFSPAGHVDFYPNGGLKQPGCPENALETVSYASLGALLRGLDQAGEEVTCRHGRAIALFLETVRGGHDGCIPMAYPCPDWDAFRNGLCTSCGPEGKECGVMGLRAEEFKLNSTAEESRPKLYLMTAGARPFCFFHYSVRVRIPEMEGERSGGGLSAGLSLLPVSVAPASVVPVSVGPNYGQLKISMTGDRKVSAHGVLGQGNQVFHSGSEYQFIFVSEQDLGQVRSLVLKWRPASAGILSLKLTVSDELSVGAVLVQPMHGSDRHTAFTFRAPQGSPSVATGGGLLMTREQNQRP